MPETSDSPNRKPLWDALERVMGYRPLLRRECTLWGKITRDWAADGITPDQVERAAKGYRKLYPTLAFTVTALDRHFSASLAEVSKQGAARRDYHSSTGQVSETLVPPPPGFAESLRQTRKAMP